MLVNLNQKAVVERFGQESSLPPFGGKESKRVSDGGLNAICTAVRAKLALII